jgi:hypothetical protein
MSRLTRALAFGLCGVAVGACAHAEPSALEPEVPEAAAPPAAASKGPETTLRVSCAPIESLRSPFFAALELTFENPSGAWHEVRHVAISPERQMFGPTLETLEGARLRAWQLAAREAHQSGDGPAHLALDTLAPDVPAGGEAGKGAASGGAPPHHLLAGAFMIAPGLSARKWVVLYSSAKDALLGQDLLLAYELEDGKVERVLVQYPKPAAKP